MTQPLFPRDENDAGAGSPADPWPSSPHAPLADRMRPRSLDEMVGQEEVLGEGTILRRAIEADEVRSLILWGPPGSGKTTLAAILAHRTRARFVPFSAVLSGVKEIRQVMAQAEDYRRATGRRTILFVDEIHRFNRAQQDAFLPYVERGEIVLVGATTENPSFEVNAALLSRCRVYVLRPLGEEEIMQVLRRALADGRGLAGAGVEVEEAVLRELAARSLGDARFALNTLELASLSGAAPGGPRRITRAVLADAMQQAALRHDKAGEEHFNLISALHKSMRASDPDAALYWLARMIEGGEDPLYVARRIVRFASEDVGNADPRALSLALAARDAVHFLGLPEGALALAQAAVYCATAPKSDRVYRAYGEAVEAIRSGAVEPVPLALRNAPTGLMANLGFGKGYQHAHQFEGGVTDMECLPPGLRGRRFYRPGAAGFEKTIRALMEKREEIRRRRAAEAAGKPGARPRRDDPPDRGE